MTFASKVTNRNTRVGAVIYRHGKDPIYIAPEGPLMVTSCAYNKALGGAASGQWSITFKASRRFDVYREIDVDDWCVWWWEINGHRYHGAFGPIGMVQEGDSSSGGATVVEHTISGSDFGRLIDRTKVWFDDFSEYENNVGGKAIGSRMDFTPTGSPDQVIEAVLDAFLGQDGIIGGAWRMPRGMGWIGDFFSLGLRIVAQSTLRKAQPRVIGQDAITSTLANGTKVKYGRDQILRGEVAGPELVFFQPQPGTMLTPHLNGFSNDLLNELYFDSLTEKETADSAAAAPENPVPAVFARERPFINTFDGAKSPWFSLPTISMRREDGVLVRARSRSADERVNCILLYASNLGFTQMDQYALNPPAYIREEVARYGFCVFERQTSFAGVGETSLGIPWGEELTKWVKLLASWYGLNHRWRSGNVTIAGIVPDARVGRRLLIDDESPETREQFYVENVAHQWTFGSHGSTSLGVTRGFRGTDQDLVSEVAERAAMFQRGDRGGAKVGIKPGALLLEDEAAV
jgi:hypothetical protein